MNSRRRSVLHELVRVVIIHVGIIIVIRSDRWHRRGIRC